MNFIRHHLYEIIVLIGVLIILFLFGAAFHLDAKDAKAVRDKEQVKCESLFYLSETPKDSLLIIRADPKCNEF